MDYEAIDRDMSCWVVTCVKNGTRFWIADNESETATDIWGRARRYRYFDLAESAAGRAIEDFQFGEWMPMSVPEAITRKAHHLQCASIQAHNRGERSACNCVKP